MNIAYKGKFLKETLKKEGHNLYELNIGPEDSLHKLINNAPFNIDLVLWEFFGGFSNLPALTRCSAPIAAYCIDSPINEFWFKKIANNFNLVMVDQPQTIPALDMEGIKAKWLPLPAKEEYFQPPREKKYDITFIGTVDKHRYKRNNLLNLLRSRFNINIMSGVHIPEAQKIFSESKIIINENLFPGITLRVLQGLSAGTIVFTEKSFYNYDLGLRDGQDLIFYDSSNLIPKLAEVLDNYQDYAQIAAQGQKTCRDLFTNGKPLTELLKSLPEKLDLSDFFYEWNLLQAEALYAQRFGGNLTGIVKRLIPFTKTDKAAEAFLTIGDIQARTKYKEKARESYKEALRIDPKGYASLKLALLNIAQNNLQGALNSISAWLKYHPEKSANLKSLLIEKNLTSASLLLLISKIYFKNGKIWDMGFNKSFPDPVPDTAFELANLSYAKEPGQKAIEMMLRCLKPRNMQGELLPLLLQAVKLGLLSNDRVLETAKLAHEYYDPKTAQEIMRGFSGRGN